MERRMLSRRIEIYHLLEDFKLAAGCLPVEGKEKQEILQDISFGLERNVLVLLECPHLLHSCIRNASKAVARDRLIPHVSAPWLEWNVYAFPDLKIGNMHCFATSSDKKTVAGAKGRSLLFFDASTAETVRGPFEIAENTIDKIDHILTVECCFAFHRLHEKLILCGEYAIEIWEYTKPSCRLLTRLGVERPYNSVTFSQCTISLDNQLLVCCIANRILVYSLHDPDVNSSKRVLRGHLGRIEFCRYLKVNRYLFPMVSMKTKSFVFTSSGRVCTIKLCELGCSLSLKPLMAPAEFKMEIAETSLQLTEQIASTSQIPTSSSEDDSDEDDSDEDMYEYYLEHDILDEFD
ncbi:hypothetical protein OS493_037536 [Desmophyllum pertusum]|uniref:Uncharacterized protein n=1 Tax=Desmophyllum pertusum TaxID=174260 RepID=A0A9W9Z9F0_9CNID|nr:hypothetical protein OS493_037536 [Desmophyllum pertusum]